MKRALFFFVFLTGTLILAEGNCLTEASNSQLIVELERRLSGGSSGCATPTVISAVECVKDEWNRPNISIQTLRPNDATVIDKMPNAGTFVKGAENECLLMARVLEKRLGRLCTEKTFAACHNDSIPGGSSIGRLYIRKITESGRIQHISEENMTYENCMARARVINAN